jgi:hypothetical protein
MKKFILSALLLATITTAFLTSCVKQKFDSPPDSSSFDPNLPVNSTIEAVKNLYQGTPTRIDSNFVVSGIVTADDRSGSFYKQIIIQDSTSGIVILLGRTGLYADYPIGRKVYVKCKGLFIGAYGGFVQLGYTPDVSGSLSDIPAALIDDHIVKANTGNTVVPRVVSVNDLKTFTTTSIKWLGTLIIVDSTQFLESQVGEPYAQAPTVASGTDRTIEDCVGKNIVIRMSGYSLFRDVKIPAGRGPVTAIYSRYNSTAQLLIRDTTDIKMYGPRCGGVVILPGVRVTIDSIRRMFTGTGVRLGNYEIKGVVTSSFKDSNIARGTLYMQDESNRGINVYFGNTSLTYQMGDSISIDVSNDSLIIYKGILEIKGVSTSSVKKTTSGNAITPVDVTAAQLTADFAKPYTQREFECRVVRISNCVISGSPATYGDASNAGRVITDVTGTFPLYCRNAEPYKSTPYKTGSVSITGIASHFNAPQLLIRSLADVQ